MFLSTEQLAFVEEMIRQIAGQSASPGFTWGRSGNCTAGTWLLNDSVPCNKSGRPVALNGATITNVLAASKDIQAWKLAIYEHDGDENGLTLLGTVDVLATTRGQTFDTSIAVTKGKQLAVRVATDSPSNPNEVDVGLILAGTTTV